MKLFKTSTQKLSSFKSSFKFFSSSVKPFSQFNVYQTRRILFSQFPQISSIKLQLQRSFATKNINPHDEFPLDEDMMRNRLKEMENTLPPTKLFVMKMGCQQMKNLSDQQLLEMLEKVKESPMNAQAMKDFLPDMKGKSPEDMMKYMKEIPPGFLLKIYRFTIKYFTEKS